jgi:psp operon transcriptional activator
MERQSFIGQSLPFLDAIELAGRAAALDRPVLVIGERGTGKELIAQRLHHLSARWDKPLVTMNCAALPETLIEAELFGHEAGAFTGATRARAGRFEEADGGTLFLDELGTLSMAAQERLLRVVEYGEVTRIGASRPVTVNVRIVAATNENLPAAADRGSFRADLLDRLSFEVITLPPLRARDGDVAVLADHFGRRMASEIGWLRWPGFSDAVMAAMEAYRWPGNVRELRNVVERVTLLSPRGQRIEPWHLPAFGQLVPGVRPDAPDNLLQGEPTLDDVERRYLALLLDRYDGNRRRVAEVLGISERTAYRMIERFGLR